MAKVENTSTNELNIDSLTKATENIVLQDNNNNFNKMLKNEPNCNILIKNENTKKNIEPTTSNDDLNEKINKEKTNIENNDEKNANIAKNESKNVKNSTVKDENGFLYYSCRFCGLTFNFMTTLKAHERVHDVIQPYLCNKCGESFHYMCELEYHTKSHLKQDGYKCDCGRTFYQYTELLYHCHPDEDNNSNQSSCASTSQIKETKQLSISASDFPVPNFVEKGFEPKHPLKVYSEVRSKPYICQYCSKSYADSRNLAYHMYSHRGEKIFNPRASRYLMCRNENSYISPGVPF